MRKLLSAALAITLIAGIFIAGAGQPPATLSAADVTETQQNILTVNGKGVVTVTPDIAYINIGVDTENEDASIAQAENAKLMTSVKNAIMKAGIKEADMKTMNYNIYKSFNYRSDDEREEVFRVSNSLRVTVRDLDKLGDLIDTAAKSGANQINSIQFTVEDEEAYYQEALVLAMENAKGKADAILGTLNKTAGMPVRISEQSYGGSLVRNTGGIAFEESKSMDFATPIEAGDIQVTATLSVEYDY